MKKQIKAILASLLVAAMATSVVGCNNGGSTTSSAGTESKTESGSTESKGPELEGNLYVTGLPILKEQETFKVLYPENTVDKSANGPADKYAIIESAKATNVVLDWDLVSGSFGEQMSLRFAGGADSMPDMILASVDVTTFSKNLESMYVFTDDVMEKYAPTIKKQYDEHDAWDLVKAPDGKIHSLLSNSLSNPENWPVGVQLIRQDWLDNLGLKLPTTIDEYYNVLKAFKTEDANKNGDKNDEIPLNFCQSDWCSQIMTFAGPWGIGGSTANGMDRYFKIKDGKVSTILDTDAFKEFLQFYNKLANEQLINVEGFSMTNAQYNSMKKEELTGTYQAWSDDMTKWTVLPPVKVEGYDQIKMGSKKLVTGNSRGFIITTGCKNPLALLRWWDYLHETTQRKFEMFYGKEGTLWETRSDGKVWAIFPEEGEGKLTREEIKQTEGLRGQCPVIWDEEVENYDGEKYPLSVVRENYTKQLEQYFPKEIIPTRNVNEEKQSEKNMLETEFTEYLNEFIALSVTKGLSDAQWETHKAKIKELGVDEWVQWYQDFLDKKF